MKTNNILLFSLLIFFSSCKTKVIENREDKCQIIKTKNEIEYTNDLENIEKEINSFKGLIKDELNKFYKSNYKYDFLTYEFISNQNEWFFVRIYFDDINKKWFIVKQEESTLIKTSIYNELENDFKKVEKGGFMVQNNENAGDYKNYLVKTNGVLKTQVAVISQNCTLLNTKLHSLGIIEDKLIKILNDL